MFYQKVYEGIGKWIEIYPFGENSTARISFLLDGTKMGSVNVNCGDFDTIENHIKRAEIILGALKQAKEHIDNMNGGGTPADKLSIHSSEKHEFEHGHPDDIYFEEYHGKPIVEEESPDIESDRDNENYVHDSDMGAKG